MSSGDASSGANSRNHDRRTFMKPVHRSIEPSELLEEADVVAKQVAQVLDAVALLGEAVNAEAKGEPLPLLAIDAAVLQDVRVDHAAPAQFHVGAVGTKDVELGRRLGEREVRRAQSRCEVATEAGLAEGVDRACEAARPDAPAHPHPPPPPQPPPLPPPP